VQSKPSSHVDTHVLLRGFNAARERFAASQPPADEAFHAIFETLAWAGVLRDRVSSEGKQSPPRLDGLWFVRNLVLHQGADVLEWVFIPGAELGTLVLGVSQFGAGTHAGWWWQSRSELPAGRSEAGAAEYDAQLAGREVVEALRQVADDLSRLT
jgi:hypothetical protein